MSGPRVQAGDQIPNGWFWDGEQQCFHDGTGNFYIGEQWYARPELLAAQPFPAPPSKADRARMEVQRLTTPWPTYGDAWRAAKAQGWLCRRVLKTVALLMPLVVLAEYAVGRLMGYQQYQPDGSVTPHPAWMSTLIFANIVALVLIAPCFWRVYHRHLRSIDRHKAAAFSVATYGVVAVGAHAAANGGHVFRKTRDHVANQAQRFTP